MQHLVEDRCAQAEDDDDGDQNGTQPTVRRKDTHEITILFFQIARLGKGQYLCGCAHHEGTAECQQPTALVMIDEMAHEKLTCQKSKRDQRIEDGRHPYEG